MADDWAREVISAICTGTLRPFHIQPMGSCGPVHSYATRTTFSARHCLSALQRACIDRTQIFDVQVRVREGGEATVIIEWYAEVKAGSLDDVVS
jgi:hypothetical protein